MCMSICVCVTPGDMWQKSRRQDAQQLSTAGPYEKRTWLDWVGKEKMPVMFILLTFIWLDVFPLSIY